MCHIQFPPSTYHCLSISRKVHASVTTQATVLAAALDCHTLAYGCLWSPRSRRVHAYHAERNHKIPSQFERSVQDTPTCENPSKGLFYNGPEIPPSMACNLLSRASA